MTCSTDFTHNAKIAAELVYVVCHFGSLLLMSPFLATSFGIALPAWIVDQKNSMLVYINECSIFSLFINLS